jgi:hypothetical protein
MATAAVNTRAVRRDYRGTPLAPWIFALFGFVRSLFYSREVANSVDRSYSSRDAITKG